MGARTDDCAGDCGWLVLVLLVAPKSLLREVRPSPHGGSLRDQRCHPPINAAASGYRHRHRRRLPQCERSGTAAASHFALRQLPWLRSDGLSEQAHCGGGCGLSEQVEPGLPEQVEQGQQAGALALQRLRSV